MIEAETTSMLDANCCGSLSSYTSRLKSCITAHAFTCIDSAGMLPVYKIQTQHCYKPKLTSLDSHPAFTYTASYNTGEYFINPLDFCPHATAAAATTSNSAAATAGGSGAAATGTVGPASPTSIVQGAAPKIGPSLKIYLGVVLVGALTGLGKF